MRRHLHIVGTGHHYQFGAGVQFGKYLCSADDQAAFLEMLRMLVLEVSAGLLAEELNVQALHEQERQESVSQLLSRELGIPHLFCEPDRTERSCLGIRDENEIRLSTFPGTLEEVEVQRLAAESRKLREDEWLRRIDRSSATLIVFVCGADHVATFPSLARERGFDVSVRHNNWQA